MIELTPPKQITLLISVLVAIFAALVHWGVIPVTQLHSGFTVLLIGYLILLAGNVVRGI
jgi:hypothetical protein